MNHYTHFEERILKEMTTLYDAVLNLETQLAAIQTQLANPVAPVVDLSTVAKADALAAVATQVAEIDAQVKPTPVA